MVYEEMRNCIVSKTFIWVVLISYLIGNNNNTKYQYNDYLK